MSNISSNIFQQTMLGLEAGLQVQHIATFDLQTCDSDEEEVASVFARFDQFDQIPVQRHGSVVGVIESEACSRGGQVKDCMRLLNDLLLVSAYEPLMRLISHMDKTNMRYLLVLGGKEEQGIKGIVTRSDLLKLPVRLLAFSLITHLEMLMSGIILKEFPKDEQVWLSHLSPSRRENIRDKWEKAKQDRIDPPMLEFTDFCDKRDTLRKMLKLNSRFVHDLKRIEGVRNTVAHAGNYAENDEQLKQFIRYLLTAQYWIKELTPYLQQT